MGQLRRKVHNYTILVLIKEGSMPDFHVKSLAALPRVAKAQRSTPSAFRTAYQKEDRPLPRI